MVTPSLRFCALVLSVGSIDTFTVVVTGTSAFMSSHSHTITPTVGGHRHVCMISERHTITPTVVVTETSTSVVTDSQSHPQLWSQTHPHQQSQTHNHTHSCGHRHIHISSHRHTITHTVGATDTSISAVTGTQPHP